MVIEEYEYVSNIFRMRFPEYYMLDYNDNNLKSSKIRKIIESVCRGELSKYSKEDYNNGSVENVVYKALDKQVDNYFSKDERSNIREKFSYICSDKFFSKYVGKCSYDLLNYLAGQILIILHDKDVTLCDDKIILHYEELYNKVSRMIRKKVESVITKNVEVFNLGKINYEQIINDITSDLILNFNINLIGISGNKKVEKIILDMFSRNIHKASIERSKFEEKMAYNYILDYVSSKHNTKLNNEECKKCADFIFKKLTSRYSYLDITEKKLDSNINVLCNFWLNSCRVESVPLEEEYKPQIKKGYKGIITVLLVATLTISGLSVIAYNNIKGNIVEGNAISVMTEDGFPIENRATAVFDYSYNIKKILAAYNKQVDYLPNERCDYIAFSESYLQLDASVGVKLVVMDRLLSALVREAASGTTYNDFYYGMASNRCCLELMYKSLKYMGYDEVDQVQYKVLLDKYLKIRKEYPNADDPLDKMSITDKNLIKKIESKYIELSKEKLHEISKLPIYGDEKNVNEGRGGRL